MSRLDDDLRQALAFDTAGIGDLVPYGADDDDTPERCVECGEILPCGSERNAE